MAASEGGAESQAKVDGPAANEAASPIFEQQFQELTSLITFFEKCSNETEEFIKNMKKTLFENDEGATLKTDLITEAERKQLQSYTAKKSTLLVVGQTNSGKSSLVNELLGGSYMPTSEVPCTSRIVRLKYSDKNYIQVLGDPDCSEGHQTFFNLKKVPMDAIVLDDSKRSDAKWVNSVVEVGLDNSLLQNGHLEVIDAPGMSENETLDKIVEECIRGALQVIIYVIDGNSSLRLQERGFLLDLKEKIGHLPIFYVCNKVDQDEKARKFDEDSDSEEDEEEEEPGTRTAQEKQDLAYSALQRCNLVPEDVTLTECDVFHGISSKEVRIGRRKNQTNHYTKQFDLLKTKLLKFAARGVTSHLNVATQLLCQIEERVFEFFLSCDLKDDGIADHSQLFDDLKQKEEMYFDKMRKFISYNQERFANCVENAITADKLKIATEAEEMPFAPIQIGDVVGRNEVVHQCQKQIKDVVLFKIMNICMRQVQKEIRVVTEKLQDSLEKTFSEVARKDDRVATIVKRQLEYSFLQRFQLEGDYPHFDYALMKFGVKYWDEAKKVASDLWSAFRGKGTMVNKEWKRQIATNVIESVDSDAIANRICNGILSNLHDSHVIFLANLDHMKAICNAAAEQSDEQRKYASIMAPDFARQMCETKALSQSLAHVLSKADLGAKVGRQGHRGIVREDRTDGGRVAKQLNSKLPTYCGCLLAVTRTMKRIQDDAPTILKPISLILDKENTITILFPRIDADLFEVLESGRVRTMPMASRLGIVQNMIDACRRCWGERIHHLDLRITNILLDRNNRAKLNVSKPRDDSILYPDEKAPFHLPEKDPDPRNADQGSVDTRRQHCLYSLAVLLWMLLAEKYCRPEYADTSTVEDVFAAIAQKKDIKYFSEFKAMSVDQDAPNIVNLYVEDWRRGCPLTGLEDFEEGITTLRSRYEQCLETTV